MYEKIGVKTSPLSGQQTYTRCDNNKDIFIISQINCSCVGFTSHLDLGIDHIIADKIMNHLRRKDIITL